MSMGYRKPLYFEGRWLWHNRDHALTSDDDQLDHLPGDVFRRLTGFIPRDNPRATEMVKAYPTRTAAVEAFGRAVVSTATTRD